MSKRYRLIRPAPPNRPPRERWWGRWHHRQTDQRLRLTQLSALLDIIYIIGVWCLSPERGQIRQSRPVRSAQAFRTPLWQRVLRRGAPVGSNVFNPLSIDHFSYVRERPHGCITRV
jgi:hypothetical protein